MATLCPLTRHSTGSGLRAPDTPVFERVVTGESETFLWRRDDYPWERNVWNVHPEIEIHLVRNASGVVLVGDHIGPFEPGHLAMVGGGLPHDWVTPIRPGEVIPGRDIVVQFDPDRLLQAASLLPEVAEIRGLLGEADRGLAFHGETRREAAALMETMGAVRGLERLALFFQLLKTLASGRERLSLSSDHFVPSTDHRTLDTAASAFAFVVENFRADISLSDLARHLGIERLRLLAVLQEKLRQQLHRLCGAAPHRPRLQAAVRHRHAGDRRVFRSGVWQSVELQSRLPPAAGFDPVRLPAARPQSPRVADGTVRPELML